MTMNRFVILTGVSGAGRTTALQALEDLGFFTTDNLPPSLWSALLKQSETAGLGNVAVSVDIRTRAFLASLEASLAALKGAGVEPEILFLDASDDVLVRRYNLTRRTHPLGQAPLSNDLHRERETLGYLRARADTVLDTSRKTAKDLVETLRQRFSAEQQFWLRLISFGFKRGVPMDADNIFDLRALPNPYYEPSLRPIDGRDERVQAYVFSRRALEFYSEMREFIRRLTGLAQETGRSSYTVAVGCTGGQHRSVAVAERLAHDLSDYVSVHVEHRDVNLALQEHAGSASTETEPDDAAPTASQNVDA